MGPYNPDDTDRLLRFWERTASKKTALIESLIHREYRTARAKEFARHGVGRRFSVMKDCIDILFDALPPDSETLPSQDQLNLATIAMQSFLINIFGAADNLARLWVEHRDVRHPQGRRLRDSEIGMAAKYALVRNSFPAAYRDYLATREGWLARWKPFVMLSRIELRRTSRPSRSCLKTSQLTARSMPRFGAPSKITSLRDQHSSKPSRPPFGTFGL